MTNEQAQWLTVKEAAQALGKSERTIRRWIATKRLPSTRIDDGPLLADVTGTPRATPETPLAETEAGGEQAEATGTPQAENALLRDERDYLRQQVNRLEGLLESQNVIIQTMQITQQKALPDPARRRPWWKRFSGWIDPTADVDE